MQFITLNGRNWLHEVWDRKTSVLAGMLAIVSLSLAHYAGFLMEVPLQIVAVAGLPLAKGVTATFLFYVFFCAVSARVLISILQLIMLPFLAVTDRIQRGFPRRMTWPHQRRFVRSHSDTIKWEGFVWFLMQLLLFVFLMLAIYVKFTMTWLSGIGVLISIMLVILSGLVRAGFFLQPRMRTFIHKIKKRRARFGRAASAAFVTLTAAFIIVAFFMGAMRASLLRDQNPHIVMTKDFTGAATVIASSEGSLLLFQKHGEEFRYIYSASEFTASMETKPVFPPLTSRKGGNDA